MLYKHINTFLSQLTHNYSNWVLHIYHVWLRPRVSYTLAKAGVARAIRN